MRHKSHFVRKFTGKMPDMYPATPILCEPAQSKCTWTWHKRHFAWKLSGKMPDATDTTSIEHRALTPTVRTPSVWPHYTVWGKSLSALQRHKGISQQQLKTEKCRTPGERHMGMSQEAFIVRKFRGKMLDAYPGASILCEPAQSKWFQMHIAMSQEASCAKS